LVICCVDITVVILLLTSFKLGITYIIFNYQVD
jgi:hypothetical protein